MNRNLIGAALVALPLTVGGIVAASSQNQTAEQQSIAEAYICPVTGEELPCPGCCVLNQKK
jgi:hypothetical protein